MDDQVKKQAYELALKEFCYEVLSSDLFQITEGEAKEVFSRIWNYINEIPEGDTNFWEMLQVAMENSSSIQDYVRKVLKPYLKVQPSPNDGSQNIQDLIDCIKTNPLTPDQLHHILLMNTTIDFPRHLVESKKTVIEMLEATRDLDRNGTNIGFLGKQYTC